MSVVDIRLKEIEEQIAELQNEKRYLSRLVVKEIPLKSVSSLKRTKGQHPKTRDRQERIFSLIQLTGKADTVTLQNSMKIPYSSLLADLAELRRRKRIYLLNCKKGKGRTYAVRTVSE